MSRNCARYLPRSTTRVPTPIICAGKQICEDRISSVGLFMEKSEAGEHGRGRAYLGAIIEEELFRFPISLCIILTQEATGGTTISVSQREKQGFFMCCRALHRIPSTTGTTFSSLPRAPTSPESK